MKFETHLFGNVDVSDDKIITFPLGLIGFEDQKRFMLVHEEDKKGQHPSFTLQSLDDGSFALQIVDPTAFGFHYELALSEEETVLLQNPTADDVAVMQVVYKNTDGGKDIAANLRAPLVINFKARVGLQKVMEKLNPNIVLSNLVSEV